MDWRILIVFLAASAAAAAPGSIFKPGDWYEGLKKPAWTPKKWMFPVVWTLLYISSAYAAARVAFVPGNGLGLGFWAMQIAFNTLWTPVFFGARRMGLALIVMAGLWVGVAGTMISFLTLDQTAGLLIVPYLAWVSLAAALNAWLWRANA